MDDFGAETYWASSEIGNDFWIARGGSVGQMYGYKSAGRYEVSDFEGYDANTNTWILKEGVADATAAVGRVRPGTMKIQDLSGKDGTPDGVIDANDKTIIGDTNPDEQVVSASTPAPTASTCAQTLTSVSATMCITPTRLSSPQRVSTSTVT